jgi:hypothetical protein
MNYRFTDGRLITPDAAPPPSVDQRIAWLEQRVADLEDAIIAMRKAPAINPNVARADPLEHLK